MTTFYTEQLEKWVYAYHFTKIKESATYSCVWHWSGEKKTLVEKIKLNGQPTLSDLKVLTKLRCYLSPPFKSKNWDLFSYYFTNFIFLSNL